VKGRNGLICFTLIFVAVVTAVIFAPSLTTSSESAESAILEHFNLSPKEYTHRSAVVQSGLWDTNLTFFQVLDQWTDNVHKVGDSMPTWFVGREGVFVVVQRPDGSLVGTRWLLVGGKMRFSVCRDENKRLCGISLKRVGGTWVMDAPITRPPLP